MSYCKIIKIPKHGKKYIDKNDPFCNTKLPFIDGLCRLFEKGIFQFSLFPPHKARIYGQKQKIVMPDLIGHL